MDPFDKIRIGIEQRLRYQAQEIETSIADHEQILHELKSKQEARPSQVFRASQKLPEHAHCPKCWILDGALHELNSLNGGKDYDLFRCRQCGTEIEVPF